MQAIIDRYSSSQTTKRGPAQKPHFGFYFWWATKRSRECPVIVGAVVTISVSPLG